MSIRFELIWNFLQSYNRSVTKYEDSYLAPYAKGNLTTIKK